MPSLSHYPRRRAQLLENLSSPALLMAGGLRPRNYPQNPYPYRADSNFLFLFHRPEPDSAAFLDPADGSVTLFLRERTPDDALWHGPEASFDRMRETHGVRRVLPVHELRARVQELAGGRDVQTLAVADPKATALAASITGTELDFDDAERQGGRELIGALSQLRLRHDQEAIAEMRRTAVVTREAHLAAIMHTRAGVYEQELAGLVEGAFARHGCVPAYNTILSVRGEVLHNNRHDNLLKEPDIVLLDAGAENETGYCSDVTRSWPVGGKFGAEAREVYETVLRAQLAAIEMVRPGTRYRDVHEQACRVLTEGLIELGCLRGSIDDIVEAGAHAMFFPHGIGHLIGLDVHDMEAFGDRVSYAPGRTRSTQFGTRWLRLDLDLEPGMAVTIEPGIYFVPAILQHPELRDRFREFVDFERAEHFLTMHGLRGFGGIRIEDDVLTTTTGHEVLTAAIPKELAVVEALVGTTAR